MDKLKSIILNLSKPGNAEKWFTEEWKEKLSIVKEKDDIPYVVFFGEVLKIRDSIDDIFFETSSYEPRSVYGPEHDWKLRTKNLLMSRDNKETLSDSWQSIEVFSNSFITEGFSTDFYIDWNGKFLGAVDITLGGIPEEKIELIRLSAIKIFHRPSYQIKDFREEEKRESELKRRELFPDQRY